MELEPFDIGRRFAHFYQARGHRLLPRGSLLDPAIPMTFVGSAGLSQIEAEIEQGRDHEGERYVLLQPCFRHFDLEKVGRSPVHLSLFTMGGAFAFGRVDRRETLGRIWEFLTEDVGLDRERLWATYLVGGWLEGHPFPADEETARAWREIGLAADHLIGVGAEMGLWKQGDGLEGRRRFRKCAPTTELFFDRGVRWSCGPHCRPGCRCGRFIEIANVLFIHWQIDAAGDLVPLPIPFDETVIGVERVALAAQGKDSVFDLGNLAALVRWIGAQRRDTALPDGVGKTGERIIADHIHALLFLVADGAPSPRPRDRRKKGGRARIMRLLIRGVLTQQRVLEIAGEEFIPRLVDATLRLYCDQYPHLAGGRERLLEYFDLERQRFERTLAAGYRRLDRLAAQRGVLDGPEALDMVKRRGFPLALLEKVSAQKRLHLDLAAYRQAYRQWQQSLP